MMQLFFSSSSKSIKQQEKNRVKLATLVPIKWFLANRLSSDILADIDIADNLYTFSVCQNLYKFSQLNICFNLSFYKDKGHNTFTHAMTETTANM